MLQEDGCILFYKEDTEEVQFSMPAVMYDSAAQSAYSNDIAVYLERTEGKYVLRLTPSFDWLADSVRKYPVSVAPTVTDPVGATPSGKHARQIYTLELTKENFYIILGLLGTRTYVYYREVGRRYMYF